MTGRPIERLSLLAPIRLAVIPVLALLLLAVTGDSVHAAGTFNPQSASRFCKEGSGEAAFQAAAAAPGTAAIACDGETSPGSHPDLVSKFNIGLGANGFPGGGDDTNDYNFGGVVAFSPSSPTDADIPDGAILGKLKSIATLGVLSNACNLNISVDFTFMEGTTDINNTVEPYAWGPSSPRGNNDLAGIAGDTSASPDGTQEINPPPAVTKYPSYLNAIFDPDWKGIGPDLIAGNADDENGPEPPLKPRFRFVGVTAIPSASNLWVVLQGVVFEPGTKLPQFPQLDAGYGYPSVTVLQTASAAGNATPPAPSAVTDFCSPLKVDILSYGVTQDNPATPGNDGGIPIRTLPAAGAADACQQVPPGAGCIVGFNYGSSQRDADGDGYENALDSCPFHADDVWDPRVTATAGDQDKFTNQPYRDGITDKCDPTRPDNCPIPNNLSPDPNDFICDAGDTAGSSPPANQPTDHDGDGFPNRGDNCPTAYNPDQADKDLNAAGEEVGDGIGDACDTPGTDGGSDCAGPNCTGWQPLPIPARSVAGNGPGTFDGQDIPCIRVNTIVVGGSPDVGYTECLAALPSLSQPLPPPGSGGGGGGAGTGTGAGGTGGTTAGGVGGPSSGIGSLSPTAGTIPAWAAIAAGLAAAGAIGSLGVMASRLIKRRRDV